MAWVAGVVAVTGLYILGPLLWFNRAEPPILGMPPLYFWFVLIPLVSPAILGTVFLVDRACGGIGTGVREEA
jgi:hypothetical protein